MKTALRAAWMIAALNTLLLAASIGFRPRHEPRPSDNLRIMTLNAQFFMGAQNSLSSNLDALSDLIAAEAPDVIALQETDANSPTGANQNGVWWLSRARDLHYYYGPPTSSYTPGVALLSGWSITSAGHAMLPARHSIPRGTISGIVVTPVGPIQVIVAHVQWAEQPGETVVGNREDQVAQIDSILKLVRADMPVVIMGDFNAGPGYPGPAYEMLSRDFVDAWVAAGNPMESAAGYTWPSVKPDQRIDQVWLSKDDWTVTPGSARVLGTTRLSDHRAVIVEVQRTR
jgi:endonuclease/exonuclease/phosphatase family metal-dependent hydrolase